MPTLTYHKSQHWITSVPGTRAALIGRDEQVFFLWLITRKANYLTFTAIALNFCQFNRNSLETSGKDFQNTLILANISRRILTFFYHCIWNVGKLSQENTEKWGNLLQWPLDEDAKPNETQFCNPIKEQKHPWSFRKHSVQKLTSPTNSKDLLSITTIHTSQFLIHNRTLGSPPKAEKSHLSINPLVKRNWDSQAITHSPYLQTKRTKSSHSSIKQFSTLNGEYHSSNSAHRKIPAVSRREIKFERNWHNDLSLTTRRSTQIHDSYQELQ